MKHFKNIKSFEDLKEQFKKLARVNHPDAGGDPEVMKAINGEYDQLFPIWKHKYNTTASEPTKETADSTRSEFYTAYGWKGSKHDWSRSTKEVAALIRAYVKEVYPTYKFSIRYSHASMCSEIHIELKEAPHDLYKNIEELNEEETNVIRRKLVSNHLFNKDSWFDHELKAAIIDAWNKSDFYKVYNDITLAVIEDVNREVNSYNFNDCDAMTDYFHVDFYYFGCKISNDFKIVEKTVRIKKQKETSTGNTDTKEIESVDNNYTYDVKKDTDSRDNSTIFVVKVIEKLDRNEYIKVNNYMKSIGGYYSKFKHGFIFKEDPNELLNSNKDNNTQETTKETQEKKQQAEQTRKQSKKQSLIEKINKQIDSMQKKIDSLSGDYKTNTWKRMNEQASRDRKIEGYQMDINTLQYLIDTLDNRELTALEENLIVSSFRSEIYSYYVRHNAYLEKKGTALREVSFPEINKEYPDSWINKEVPTKQKRLNKANIYNTNDLLKAVEEYAVIHTIINKPVDYKEKKIKQLEREYKMQQKGDINFTPSEVAKQLTEYARIDISSKVLEPSAGIGNIADQIKHLTNNIDVCEQMYHFSELLKLKGYNVVDNDFLEYETNNKYDAIIMNPPFSDEQNHIKHAYDLLKNGGTLVSISSPHWTFANDKKSVEFREWLENETYFIEDLKGGTFEMTGVATKIIVIEKHEQDNIKTA